MVDSDSDRLVVGRNASRPETSGNNWHAQLWRHGWKVPIVLGGVMLLLGCNGLIPSKAPSYRYKETVVVETPQGIRTGSAVIEVQMAYVNFGDHTNLLPAHFKGEAVAVNLPNGKVLFALLSSPEHPDWAKTAFQFLIPPQDYDGDNSLGKRPEYKQFELAMDLKGAQVLPRYRKANGAPGNESAYPTLVRFRNISDPTTVEKVDPDNLAAAFGKGYFLKNIIFEKTDKPVSAGIDNKLLWLVNHRGSLAPSNREDPLPKRQMSSITEADFWTFGGYSNG